MNIKLKNPRNQANLTKSFEKLVLQTSEYEMDAAVAACNVLTRAEKDSLNVIASMDIRHDLVFPSQKTIARKIGRCRKTANRNTTRLDELGLVKKTNRGGWLTCLYKLNPIILHPALREFMSRLFPALNALSIMMLISLPKHYVQLRGEKHCAMENVPPNKKTEFYLTDRTVLEQKRVTNTRVTLQANGVSHQDSLRSASLRLPASSGSAGAQTRWSGLERKIIKKQERREEKMNIKQPTTVFKEVQGIQNEVKALKLTQWGALKLSAYPLEALRYADREIQKTKNIRSPFGLYESFCKKYLSLNGISPDIHKMARLSLQYDIPEYPEYLEENRVIPLDGDSTKRPCKGMSRREREEFEAKQNSIGRELMAKRDIAEQERKKLDIIREYDPDKAERIKANARWICEQIGIAEDGSKIIEMSDSERFKLLAEAQRKLQNGYVIPTEPIKREVKSPRTDTNLDLSYDEPQLEESVAENPNLEQYEEAEIEDYGNSYLDSQGRRMFVVDGKPSINPF